MGNLKTVHELEAELNRHRHVEDQFAALANDLNNLLAAMKGQAQLACDDTAGQEKEELVRVVLSATLKAEGILQRFVQPTEQSHHEEIQEREEPKMLTSILVVDDEVSMRNLMARILRKSGYEVALAGSGAEALDLARKRTFDLAFLDIQLGDMKGTRVFEKLQAISPGTHVIFASGDPSVEGIPDMDEEDCPASFVRKPFDIEEVKKRISYVLTMKSALE
jgi:CheY-like chemotaxis protein